MRELQWHAKTVIDDHAPGQSQPALKYGQDHLGLPRKALSYHHNTLRVRAWRKAWLPDVLYPALLSLILFLTMMGGRPDAQEPPSGHEPAPAPAVSGPFETLPSLQERILAPVPPQFNWLEREAPSNPLLESLLSLQRPSHLTVSTSLTEEASDNFAHSPGDHRVAARTGAVLGAVYRLDEGQDFVSLANTVRAFYEVPTDRGHIGFADLVLNAGYQLPSLSFGLTDRFLRDDNTAQETTSSLLQPQQRFTRNTVTPQVRYDLTPRTATTLAYTNTIVVNEDSTQGNALSHAVTAGLQHQVSRNLFGSAHYTFTTSSGAGASGRQFHRLQTELGYTFDRTTSGILSAFGTRVAQDTMPGQLSRSYGASIGVRRVLLSTVSLFGSVGPTVFKRQGEGEKLRLNWNLRLEGPLPLFATPTLTLSLTTNQEVLDTTGEVNDVGAVLRQLVAARLSYTPSAFFTSVLLVEYTRNELLENGTAVGATQGRTDNFWSTGVTASYAFTNILSLTGSYRYQRRTSNLSNNDFAENRVTIALTGTFPVF